MKFHLICIHHFAKSFVVTLTGFTLLSLSVCINFFLSNIINHTPNGSRLEIKKLNQDYVSLTHIDSQSYLVIVESPPVFLMPLLMNCHFQSPVFLIIFLNLARYLMIGRLLLFNLIIKAKIASTILITIDPYFFHHFLNFLSH